MSPPRTMVPLRTALAMTAGAVGVFFTGVYAAHAWEGRAGVEARSFLTVAGTLTGVATSPPPTMRFVFHKVGAMDCATDAIGVSFTGSAFSAQVPYDGCGRGFFDGSNVTVDVLVNGTMVVPGQPINPVPYARFADQVGTSDCPVGYERSTEGGGIYCDLAFDATNAPVPGRRDEVARVGSGRTAFWIDRFEASVWTTDGTGSGPVTYRQSGYPREFPVNGQWQTATIRRPIAFARSVVDVQPSTQITWMQAMEACRASGKRLPTSEEWLAAAQGTPDPGSNGADPMGRCRTRAATADLTGHQRLCTSAWGVQDMIGNVAEHTAEWMTGVANGVEYGRDPTMPGNAPWPAGFADDGTRFVPRGTYPAPTTSGAGLPAVVIRGGSYIDGRWAGVFAIQVDFNAASQEPNVGFRCVIPR